MKIRVLSAFMLFIFAIAFASAALVSCSSSGKEDDDDDNEGRCISNCSSSSNRNNGNSSSSSGSNGNNFGDGWPFDNSGEELTATPAFNDLGLENVIKIEYNNGSTPIIDNPYSDEVSVSITGENVVVRIPDLATTTEYNLVLSGTTTNGSLKIYGDVRKGLYLNGVRITNNSGPAINIQKSKRVNVHLVNGTENYLADGANYSEPPSGEQAKGTFFSEGKLNFAGSGSLELVARYNHAIVVDNDIEINNGKIIVSEAANDGIHANDIIEIKGGVLKITSIGDAIQSEKENNQRTITISGGKIEARTTGIKSHGISNEGYTSIRNNAIIQISVSGNGAKGIRSSGWVEFLGGKTSILTSGARNIDNSVSPPDTSTAAGVKTDASLYIDGGDLTIKSEGDKAKGINAGENVYITGGYVYVEADDDGVKVHGDLSITGGDIYVKSKKKDAFDVNGSDSRRGGNVTAIDGGF